MQWWNFNWAYLIVGETAEGLPCSTPLLAAHSSTSRCSASPPIADLAEQQYDKKASIDLEKETKSLHRRGDRNVILSIFFDKIGVYCGFLTL